MAIRITENGTVIYENEPDIDRELFPNLNGCCAELRTEIDELKEIVGTKAAAIYVTASGEIASFSDGADGMSLKSCVVNIEPIQEGSGDPSPENVRPISGRTGLTVVRTGKNLIDKSKIVQGGYVSPTSTTNVHTDGYLPIKGGETYVWNTNLAVISRYIRCFDSSFTQIGGYIINYGSGAKVFTVPINCVYFSAMWYSENEITPEDVTIDQIELGSAATDYEPYKGSPSYTVNWETEAGTVYGGSLDVVSGKLVVDRGYIANYNGETLPSTWISDRDVYAEGTTPTTGAQVVYKLTDPAEYQLTPQEIATLLGENNIWSDGGDVEVDYPVDTKMYIEKLTTPTEDDMISDHEISANSFFMVGNTLYRAITSIASGATITPGTNAMKLSLSDALNALA